MGFGALQGATALRAASADRFPTTDAENALSSIWRLHRGGPVRRDQGGPARGQTGGRIGPGVFRDSARVLHACDTVLVVQSGTVPAKNGEAAQNLLELALADERRQLLEAALPEATPEPPATATGSSAAKTPREASSSPPRR